MLTFGRHKFNSAMIKRSHQPLDKDEVGAPPAWLGLHSFLLWKAESSPREKSEARNPKPQINLKLDSRIWKPAAESFGQLDFFWIWIIGFRISDIQSDA